MEGDLGLFRLGITFAADRTSGKFSFFFLFFFPSEGYNLYLNFLAWSRLFDLFVWQDNCIY